MKEQIKWEELANQEQVYYINRGQKLKDLGYGKDLDPEVIGRRLYEGYQP